MQIIRRLAASFTIHIKHVLREFNKAPDALANKAMDAKQSLGVNPIEHLPEDEEIISAPATTNQVNGVDVKPVVRKTSAQKKPTQQPDLFGDF